ncbi:hypothetical protein [Humisphaera borealis]|uniref:Uncharacterized protein n=1 Tax=Humisphaera borealis TaxID=2807512 RepID=A0A7M2WW85_9BACT|nr:hypothetical protein [Humisphaera borealis]QOV88760.1 hypothetical protein IPV69_21400 [Humisphaera borealis]
MPKTPANPPMTTWELYKKSLPRTQISILAVTLLLYVVLRPEVHVLIAVYVLLQIFGYLGVWWGLRTARRIGETEDKPSL